MKWGNKRAGCELVDVGRAAVDEQNLKGGNSLCFCWLSARPVSSLGFTSRMLFSLLTVAWYMAVVDDESTILMGEYIVIILTFKVASTY